MVWSWRCRFPRIGKPGDGSTSSFGRTTRSTNIEHTLTGGGFKERAETYMDTHDNSDYTVSIDLIPAAPVTPISTFGIAPTARNVEAAFLVSYSARHTRRAYASDLRDWFAFCDAVGVDPLAASRAHVDAWARSLAEIDGR